MTGKTPASTSRVGTKATRDPASHYEYSAPELDDSDTTVVSQTTGRITAEPTTLRSRGRIYTTADQRRRLGIETDEYGKGQPVTVVVCVIRTTPDWGVYAPSAVFDTELVSDGAIRLPVDTRRRLGVTEGDHLRLSVKPREDQS
jgi:hypothetical protein